MHSISVIIPTLNESKNVRRQLRIFDQQSYELIFVDGGSKDDSAILVEESSARCSTVKLIASARGRGIQMNAGSQVASGEWLLFLHADCRLDPAAIKALQGLSPRQHEWGCFTQRIRNRRLVYRLLELGNHLRVRCLARPFGDQAIFVSRSALDSIGGVPEVPIMEDVLLSQKLRKSSRPKLLAARVWCSSRRWEKNGPVRQTFLNWRLQLQFAFGASPESILSQYKPEGMGNKKV